MAKSNKRSKKQEKASQEAQPPKDKAIDEEDDGSAIKQNADLDEAPADAKEDDADEKQEKTKESSSDNENNDSPPKEDAAPAAAAVDPDTQAQKDLIAKSTPTTPLEIALTAELQRQTALNARLQSELTKLQNFVSKRKQTYKRKRKDDEAPRKSLSAYNMFVRERFAKLAEENKKALESGDTERQLERVAPHKKVAEAGRAWKALSAEEKAKYEAMAKPDKDRYEEQMASYQAPERGFRKRNKTGYNLFFSAHVLRMKNTENGVPSERGSVARIVGDAWKKMSEEERDFYEREADKQNDAPERGGEGNNGDDDPLLANIPTFPGERGVGGLPSHPHPSQAGPGYNRDYAAGGGHPHPSVLHGGYYDRYGPPPYGGYDYYGYPPPPHPTGPSLSGRGGQGQPPHDPYAYGGPPY